MFFVLSSGRAGSRTIARTLEQIDGCACLHHPKPELVEEATAYYYGEMAGDKIADILRETRRSTIDGKVYGESNLQLSLLVPVLEQVFPGSQYLWLIRDGRDSVASMYHRGWYDPENKNVAAYWHKARLQGDRTGDFTSEQWSAMDRFERCCWIWSKYQQIIEKQLTPLGEHRWRVVPLENLKSLLPELCPFLGLKYQSVVVERHNAAKQPVIYWHSWSAQEREKFERLCAPAMDRFYPQWRDKSGNWRDIEAEKPYGETWLDQAKLRVLGTIRKLVSSKA